MQQQKKYSVIYADPPWQQKAGRPLGGGYKLENGKQVFNPVNNKTGDLPYLTMNLEQIKNLPIVEIAAPDAHLFLWVTNKYLMRAGEIITAWGFKYSTTLVWVKKPMGGGLGGAFRITTEFLIYATRGSLQPLKKTTGTWFDVKRKYKNGAPQHSAKPDFFRELIERTSPGPKLELFARENAPGWDAWGNENLNSITL